VMNLDFDILIARHFAQSGADALQVLEEAEQKGRIIFQTALGEDCFDDKGRFEGRFGMPSLRQTRGYMRVLDALVEIAHVNDEHTKAVHYAIERLRLGSGMGSPSWLTSLLLHVSRPADALHLVQIHTSRRHLNGTKPRRGGIDFKPPKSDPLTDNEVRRIKSAHPGLFLLYNGALASFKLWGDCELARQYLGMAILANPWVLTKSIARVSVPNEFAKSFARTGDGSDRASSTDYLFFTQKLWMEPDVYAWIDVPDVRTRLYRTCSNTACNRLETRVNEYRRCKGCWEVQYCNESCSTANWHAHKKRCREIQAQEKEYEAKTWDHPLM